MSDHKETAKPLKRPAMKSQADKGKIIQEE